VGSVYLGPGGFSDERRGKFILFGGILRGVISAWGQGLGNNFYIGGFGICWKATERTRQKMETNLLEKAPPLRGMGELQNRARGRGKKNLSYAHAREAGDWILVGSTHINLMEK